MWFVGSQRRLRDTNTTFKKYLDGISPKHYTLVLSWLLIWWILCYSRYGNYFIGYHVREGVVVGYCVSDRQDIATVKYIQLIIGMSS